MSKVKVLPTEISNKIAAGEVVERPASVIKELLENSIDSGATKITVEIKNGGISYMRVTDNGSGMDEKDAKTAFLPHATSKISVEDDLYSISTLGFRGEALASIAAVSKVDLMTKQENNDGVLLRLEGGKITECSSCGCPDGTTIVVNDLFYNTPARMKFLKKNATEGGYITDIIERIILANKDISVRYISDGKEKLFFSGDGDVKTAIFSIYGKEYADNIFEINHTHGNISIHGYIGKSEISRGNRASQSFFVNGRYIKNKALTFWAEKAYDNRIMIGKFPFIVIFIDIPFTDVDINVHPTKQEIKFADEKAVTTELYWAIKNVLSEGADEIRREVKKIEKPSFFVENKTETKKTEQTAFQGFSYDKKPKNYTKQERFTLREEKYTPVSTTEPFIVKEPEIAKPQIPQKKYDYKLIGQLFNTYIVIEIENKIILIDQHAAHERMIYEKLVEANENKKPISQILLSPVAVSLTPTEFSNYTEMTDVLEKMGFVIEDFGNNSVLVRQTPLDLGTEHIKDVVTEILDEGYNNIREDKMMSVMHTVACKAAVKGNDKLHEREIDALITELMETGGVNTCPHGRPIMISITRYELEKMFKRIQ